MCKEKQILQYVKSAAQSSYCSVTICLEYETYMFRANMNFTTNREVNRNNIYQYTTFIIIYYSDAQKRKNRINEGATNSSTVIRYI